jgi:hypothetical protein
VRKILLALAVIVVALFVSAVAAFMYVNDHWVLVRFPTVGGGLEHPFQIEEYDASLPLVMGAAAAAGFGLALLLFLPSWLRRAVERHRERRFISTLEDELIDLRNLPVDHPTPLEDIEDERRPRRRGQGRGRGSSDEDEALLAAALQEPDEEPGR